MKYSVTRSHVCKCLAGKEQQWLKTWIGGSAPGTLQLIQLPRKEVVPMHGTQNSDHIKHMFFRRLPQNMPIIVGEVPYQYSDIRSNGPSAPGIVYGNNSKRCPGFIYLHAKSSSNGVVLWMPHESRRNQFGYGRDYFVCLFAKGSNLFKSKDWPELLEDEMGWVAQRV